MNIATLPRARTALFAAAVSLLVACSRGDTPDAYGTFETTEVVVSSEMSGPLLHFTPTEGMKLAAGDVVAVVDTSPLALERNQIFAQRSATASREGEVGKQIGVLEAQRDIARRSYERTKRLFDQQAATAQQLDQTERDYRVLEEQIAAMHVQRRSAGYDVASGEARVAQIGDRIRRSQVTNPLAGTVLATYAKPGELVQPGQPLYKIANLDSMTLRAYITEPQLAQVRLGQQVEVTIDVGRDARRAIPGTVTWVSSEAEFTPTPIQTREERADLVYAVKIAVPNADGAVKIGMPADVKLPVTTASR